jgi:hypothetical protein
MEVGLAVGPLEEGLEHGRRAEVLLRGLGLRPLVHRTERAMAAIEWLLARPTEALELAEAAVVGSRDVGTRGDLAAALSILSLAELDVDDLASAQRCADESAALAGEIGSTRVELGVRAARLLVLAHLGATDQLAEDVEAGLAVSQALDRLSAARPFLAGRAWLQARDGADGAARATLASAARLVADDRMVDELTRRLEALAVEPTALPETPSQA